MKQLLLFVLFLVMVEKCASLDCDTCKGLDCFKPIIPKRRCGTNFPPLPFAFDIFPKKSNGRYEYGCLDLQYYRGKIAYRIKQCLPVTRGKCICEQFQDLLPIKHCSFLCKNQENRRRNDNDREQYCDIAEGREEDDEDDDDGDDDDDNSEADNDDEVDNDDDGDDMDDIEDYLDGKKSITRSTTIFTRNISTHSDTYKPIIATSTSRRSPTIITIGPNNSKTSPAITSTNIASISNPVLTSKIHSEITPSSQTLSEFKNSYIKSTTTERDKTSATSYESNSSRLPGQSIKHFNSVTSTQNTYFRSTEANSITSITSEDISSMTNKHSIDPEIIYTDTGKKISTTTQSVRTFTPLTEITSQKTTITTGVSAIRKPVSTSNPLNEQGIQETTNTIGRSTTVETVSTIKEALQKISNSTKRSSIIETSNPLTETIPQETADKVGKSTTLQPVSTFSPLTQEALQETNNRPGRSSRMEPVSTCNPLTETVFLVINNNTSEEATTAERSRTIEFLKTSTQLTETASQKITGTTVMSITQETASQDRTDNAESSTTIDSGSTANYQMTDTAEVSSTPQIGSTFNPIIDTVPQNIMNIAEVSTEEESTIIEPMNTSDALSERTSQETTHTASGYTTREPVTMSYTLTETASQETNDKAERSSSVAHLDPSNTLTDVIYSTITPQETANTRTAEESTTTYIVSASNAMADRAEGSTAVPPEIISNQLTETVPQDTIDAGEILATYNPLTKTVSQEITDAAEGSTTREPIITAEPMNKTAFQVTTDTIEPVITSNGIIETAHQNITDTTIEYVNTFNLLTKTDHQEMTGTVMRSTVPLHISNPLTDTSNSATEITFHEATDAADQSTTIQPVNTSNALTGTSPQETADTVEISTIIQAWSITSSLTDTDTQKTTGTFEESTRIVHVSNIEDTIDVVGETTMVEPLNTLNPLTKITDATEGSASIAPVRSSLHASFSEATNTAEEVTALEDVSSSKSLPEAASHAVSTSSSLFETSSQETPQTNEKSTATMKQSTNSRKTPTINSLIVSTTVTTDIKNSPKITSTTRLVAGTTPKRTTEGLTTSRPGTTSSLLPETPKITEIFTTVTQDSPSRYKLDDDYDYEELNASYKPRSILFVVISGMISLLYFV